MRQQYFINKHGMLIKRSNNKNELTQLKTTFIILLLTPMNIINGNADFEKLFKSTVQKLGFSNEIHEYVIATAHYFKMRKNLSFFGSRF